MSTLIEIYSVLKTHFIVRIGFFTTLCVLSRERERARERERCMFFLNFVILLTQRARLRISKIREYLGKFFFLIDEMSLSDCITL